MFVCVIYSYLYSVCTVSFNMQFHLKYSFVFQYLQACNVCIFDRKCFVLIKKKEVISRICKLLCVCVLKSNFQREKYARLSLGEEFVHLCYIKQCGDENCASKMFHCWCVGPDGANFLTSHSYSSVEFSAAEAPHHHAAAHLWCRYFYQNSAHAVLLLYLLLYAVCVFTSMYICIENYSFTSGFHYILIFSRYIWM